MTKNKKKSFSCSEQTATNITVFFPQKSGKEASSTVIKVVVHPDYMSTADTPQSTFGVPNLALLQLTTKISFTDKSKFNKSKNLEVFTKNEISEARPIDAIYPDNSAEFMFIQSLFGGKIRGCGVGFINNKGEKAKDVQCTDLDIQLDDKCFDLGSMKQHTVPKNFACVQWANKDNNFCASDFGGKKIFNFSCIFIKKIKTFK
jgi:hypothetical protein